MVKVKVEGQQQYTTKAELESIVSVSYVFATRSEAGFPYPEFSFELGVRSEATESAIKDVGTAASGYELSCRGDEFGAIVESPVSSVFVGYSEIRNCS